MTSSISSLVWGNSISRLGWMRPLQATATGLRCEITPASFFHIFLVVKLEIYRLFIFRS